MSMARDLGRRFYEPITRRIDGVSWRLDMLERHRSEAQQRQEASLISTREQLVEELRNGRDATRAELEAARADLDAAMADMRTRLDDIERRIAAGHESQVEGTAYLGRTAREALARGERERGFDVGG